MVEKTRELRIKVSLSGTAAKAAAATVAAAAAAEGKKATDTAKLAGAAGAVAGTDPETAVADAALGSEPPAVSFAPPLTAALGASVFEPAPPASTVSAVATAAAETAAAAAVVLPPLPGGGEDDDEFGPAPTASEAVDPVEFAVAMAVVRQLTSEADEVYLQQHAACLVCPCGVVGYFNFIAHVLNVAQGRDRYFNSYYLFPGTDGIAVHLTEPAVLLDNDEPDYGADDEVAGKAEGAEAQSAESTAAASDGASMAFDQDGTAASGASTELPMEAAAPESTSHGEAAEDDADDDDGGDDDEDDEDDDAVMGLLRPGIAGFEELPGHRARRAAHVALVCAFRREGGRERVVMPF
jgi:hypothetical protein